MKMGKKLLTFLPIRWDSAPLCVASKLCSVDPLYTRDREESETGERGTKREKRETEL